MQNPKPPEWLRELSVPASLRAGRAEVWLGRVGTAEALPLEVQTLLSPDEQERSKRFLVTSARAQFVFGRAALRLLLGYKLALEPRDLQFEFSAKGKPSLARGISRVPLEFNLAHSGEVLLVALAAGRAVGVDVERMQDRSELYGSAGGFLAPAEVALLREKSPAERMPAFYQIWTRKEAVLKAAGQGITSGLRLPDVSGRLDCGEEGLGVELGGRRWQVWDLVPAEGYQGAIALAEGSGRGEYQE